MQLQNLKMMYIKLLIYELKFRNDIKSLIYDTISEVIKSDIIQDNNDEKDVET